MRDHPDLMDLPAIRELRESTTPWQLSVRKAPAAADPTGRHRLLVIVSPGANTIRLMVPSTTDFTPAMLSRALEQAMLQRGNELEPARPPAVEVDDPALKEAIELPLGGCGVEVRLADRLDAIDPVVEALASHEGLFAEPPAETADGAELPALLPNEHTVAAEQVDGGLLDSEVGGAAEPSPCLVVRVFPANVEATCAMLDELEAVAFLRRDLDGRDAEIILGLVDDRPVGVLSVVGMTHDGPSLRAELDDLGADESEVTVVVATGEQLDEGTVAAAIALPHLAWA